MLKHTVKTGSGGRAVNFQCKLEPAYAVVRHRHSGPLLPELPMLLYFFSASAESDAL